MHTYLDEGEVRQATGAGGENPAGTQTLTSEALAVLLGGGKDKGDKGYKIKATRCSWRFANGRPRNTFSVSSPVGLTITFTMVV